MKPHFQDAASSAGRGSVRSDELLDLRTFGKRLGLGPRILSDLQHAGLRTVTLGRCKYLVGKWAIEFVECQAGAEGRDDG